MPYLIDGDYKLTESKAIIHYVIQKSGKTELQGKDIKDQARVIQLMEAWQETITNFGLLFWNPKYE